MNNTLYIIPGLARVLMKNHIELQRLLGDPSAPLEKSPFSVGLRLGTATGRIFVDSSPCAIEMSLSENGRSYGIKVPALNCASQPFRVEMTLEEDGKKTTQTYEGGAFWTATVPEPFRLMHERTIAHLKTVLPQPQANQSGRGAEEQNMPADEYRDYYVHRKDMQDIEFHGKVRARVSTRPFNGRQNVFTVFETRSGKLVGLKEGLSLRLGETPRTAVVIANQLDELVPFFGYGVLAKALYKRLGMPTAERLD